MTFTIYIILLGILLGAPSLLALAPQRSNDMQPSRRTFLISTSSTTLSTLLLPKSSNADETGGVVSQTRIRELLSNVPVFTIVDNRGVPFNVVGEDAIITGYFFTEYGEAKRVLDLASSSADKAIKEAKKEGQSGDDLINPWKQARISSVPLDFACTVVTKSMYSARNRGATVFQMAPSVDDIETALAITGKDDLAEGKVPLFYYENFKIQSGNETITPLYFRQSELMEAAKKEDPKVPLPSQANVTELFAVLAEMAQGTDEELKTLTFIAPKESASKAKECLRKGKNESPFIVGERILVL